MQLQLVKSDNEVLREPTREVPELTDGVKALVESLIDTLRAIKIGVGLSANQVGATNRIAVINAPKYLKGVRVLINPVITWKSEETDVKEESCLSLPKYSCHVRRAKEVIVAYTNRKGKLETLKAKGFLARIVQHELDHLDGLLIADRAE